MNGTQAAIRAGYSARTANVTSVEYLAKPSIAAEIERRVKALCERYSVTHKNVLSELAAIAFSDIRDVMELTDWGGIKIRPSEEWSEPASLAVQEVAMTRAGPKIKLASKLQALELLGRYLTLWKDERPQGGFSFTININADEAAPARLGEGNGDR